MTLQLKRIDHVGIITPNIDKALSLWRDVLGMPVVKEGVIEEQGVRGVLLNAGDGEIELIEPIRDDTGVARFLQRRGEDLHHVAFETDDVAAELQRAKALGIALIDEEPRQGLAGLVGFLHPKSNYGVLVELVQKVDAPPAPQPQGTEQPFAITGIDHVGIAARDIHGLLEPLGREIRHAGLQGVGAGEGDRLGVGKRRDRRRLFGGRDFTQAGGRIGVRGAGAAQAGQTAW